MLYSSFFSTFFMFIIFLKNIRFFYNFKKEIMYQHSLIPMYVDFILNHCEFLSVRIVNIENCCEYRIDCTS